MEEVFGLVNMRKHNSDSEKCITTDNTDHLKANFFIKIFNGFQGKTEQLLTATWHLS
jgi:hypothetical protein